jgi:DNA-binding LytR/AlgR family response regulator
MRSLIVDDEPAARSRMRRLLGAHSTVEVVGEACDGIEALEKIEQLRPDIAFLDIQMPGLSGFEVVRLLRGRTAQPLIVFVTGFDQHALEAFEANALAYLLKPVETERLAETLDRAAKICAYDELLDKERQRIEAVAEQSAPALRHIVGRKRDRLLLIEPGDVLYFAVDNGLIRARTDRDSFLVNYQLSELETRLPRSDFFRARRSALVNLKRVREIRPDAKSTFVLVIDDDRGTEIAVSERQSKHLRQRIPGL